MSLGKWFSIFDNNYLKLRYYTYLEGILTHICKYICYIELIIDMYIYIYMECTRMYKLYKVLLLTCMTYIRTYFENQRRMIENIFNFTGLDLLLTLVFVFVSVCLSVPLLMWPGRQNLSMIQVNWRQKQIQKYLCIFLKWEFFFRNCTLMNEQKKIWLGIIFISFSGSVIVYSWLVIDTADSYML